MNPYHPTTTNHPHFAGSARRWLFCAGALLLFALMLLVGMDAQRLHADNTLVHSSVNDFVKGKFYATGLHSVPSSDGEVQLLPVGFTDNWQAENAPFTLPPRAELAAVSYNNILYAIGGSNISTGYKTDIYSATTSITGAITAGWSLAGDLGHERAGHAAVISQTTTGGILYVIGGFDNANVGGGFDTIYYKTLNAGGAIAAGAWSTYTLPSALKYPSAVIRQGALYVIGGETNGIYQNTIYRIPITNASGALGSPTTYLMPNALSLHAAVTWTSPNNVDYLYILGGKNESGATSNVNFVAFNPDGSLPDPASSWVTRTLVDAFSAHGAIQSNGNVHVIAGAKSVSANDFVSQVQSALIDFSPVEGALHDWTGTGLYWIVTAPLAEPRAYHGTAINLGGYVYVIGGYDKDGNASSTVYRGTTTGVAPFHAPYGNYTNVFDTGAISNTLTSLRWTAWVTEAHTMTLRYRTSNSTTNWPSTWMSATNSITGTNTLVLPSIQNRYLQYQFLFTTTVSSTTPLLRDVQLDYREPPTPTPPTTVVVTVTVPPITPGVRRPDLILSGLEAPADKGNASPVTYTVNVSVTNWGSAGFNKSASAPPVLSKTARVGQQSSPRGTVRKLPSGIIRAGTEYTGTTNYFVWVDVYVDPITPPTIPSDVGNCPALGGGTNYAFVYGLATGEFVNLAIDCYLPQGSHAYYSQVDSCDNPPNGCSQVYGYVLELTEANNIAGPITSGGRWQGFLGWLNPIFMPRIQKGP